MRYLGHFFNTDTTSKNISATVLPEIDLTLIEPFFMIKFFFKPDSIESPTTTHVPFGQKLEKFMELMVLSLS